MSNIKNIDIRNWKTGEVIFSYKCKDNTIAKTVFEGGYNKKDFIKVLLFLGHKKK